MHPCVAIGVLLTLIPAAYGLEYVWWEGEQPKRQSGELAEKYVFNSPNARLSGGKSLGGTSKAGTFVEYELQIPRDGTWHLYIRKFWKHGPFSIAWNGQPPTATSSTTLMDRVELTPHSISWTPGGTVSLKQGANLLRLEATETYGPFVIDCFALTSSRWTPSGALKPGEKSGLEEAGTWAFEPDADDFRPDAVGLRALNEAIAGESGRVAYDRHGDFVDGKGRAMRFWAVNTGVQARAGIDDLTEHARHLAKHGVNLVRHHGHLNPGPDEPIAKVNEAQIDEIQKLVAVMKREGIYSTVSPYWAMSEGGASWGIEGHPGGRLYSLLFWDETLQQAYKGWVKELLTRPNPYEPTKTPLAKDPALAIFQIQNEDSMLFHTMKRIMNEEAKLRRLTATYHAWRAANQLPGTPPLNFKFWELGKPTDEHRDTMRFCAETMRAWNTELERFVREDCGSTVVINAGNWRTAHQVKLLDLERWSYDGNAVIGINRYVGNVHVNPTKRERAGYALDPGDLFTDVSKTLDWAGLATNARQVAGKPYIIPESTWVPPGTHVSEGPLLVAAYSALTGVDAYYWFSLGQPTWDQSASKWQAASPMVMGGWPAAAWLYRQGLVKRAPPAVHEERALDDLWQLRNPLLAEEAGFDPLRDTEISPRSNIRATVDPAAYLVGPVEVVFGGDPARSTVVDLAPFVDAKARTITSATRELVMDHGRGLFTMDAPQAQGATGFLAKAGPIALGSVTIASTNGYGTVICVALDGQPIARSRKVLVQITTQAQPHGWRHSPATFTHEKQEIQGFRIDSIGSAPWNVVDAAMTLTIANPSLRRVTQLDPNLRPTAVKVVTSAEAKGLAITPPADAMYLLVE